MREVLKQLIFQQFINLSTTSLILYITFIVHDTNYKKLKDIAR